ncbi:hypothetical protein PANT111_40141 [Pantoea brenneri]|uniref:Uncharacterized protein n=1 Tax=Pantoea brenneri TaxID=472694 RepID=A0AAX3JAE7_9GAMM|nr:hypothetical protein PANT111_40141 [Pantoea brenneri]
MQTLSRITQLSVKHQHTVFIEQLYHNVGRFLNVFLHKPFYLLCISAERSLH